VTNVKFSHKNSGCLIITAANGFQNSLFGFWTSELVRNKTSVAVKLDEALSGRPAQTNNRFLK
jgi:hypothetical protein